MTKEIAYVAGSGDFGIVKENLRYKGRLVEVIRIQKNGLYRVRLLGATAEYTFCKRDLVFGAYPEALYRELIAIRTFEDAAAYQTALEESYYYK